MLVFADDEVAARAERDGEAKDCQSVKRCRLNFLPQSSLIWIVTVLYTERHIMNRPILPSNLLKRAASQ